MDAALQLTGKGPKGCQYRKMGYRQLFQIAKEIHKAGGDKGTVVDLFKKAKTGAEEAHKSEPSPQARQTIADDVKVISGEIDALEGQANPPPQ